MVSSDETIASQNLKNIQRAVHQGVHAAQNDDVTRISSFFDRGVVFITGGTGFLGKALIEKLLRSCEGLDTIYILLRAKKGTCVEQRFKDFVKNPVFDRIRNKTPEVLEKIQWFSGDVTLPYLGLSDSDQHTLAERVSIVFHVAATVRFNENLRDAVTLNTLGTKRVMELCTTFKCLKSLVHVSTAYSNPDKPEVEEKVYRTTCSLDPQSLINCVTTLPADVITSISDRIQGPHPNTYTLTKAMAEEIVHGYSQLLPVCIVRPSIVTAAISEPFPGWVDNVFGVTGITMEIGRGTIRSAYCDEKLVVDLVPVDIVANMLICSAWHTAAHRLNTMRVYNCTSGKVNPITWKEYAVIIQKYAILNPTKYVMMYPNFKFTTNRFVHKVYEALLHVLPAQSFDLLLRLKGAKPIMAKISQRFKMALETGEFFALHEYKFHNDNVLSLNRDVSKMADADEFFCDIADMDWDKYIETCMLGIRKFVLKDSIDSMPAARKKIQNIYWATKVVQVAAAYTVYRLIFC